MKKTIASEFLTLYVSLFNFFPSSIRPKLLLPSPPLYSTLPTLTPPTSINSFPFLLHFFLLHFHHSPPSSYHPCFSFPPPPLLPLILRGLISLHKTTKPMTLNRTRTQLLYRTPLRRHSCSHL